MSDETHSQHEVTEPTPVQAEAQVVEEAPAAAAPAPAGPKRSLTPKQAEVLTASNQHRAELRMKRLEAKAAVEARARELLTKRFGADAVTAALQRRNGRPSREDSLVKAAASATVAALEKGEEPEEAPVPEDSLDKYAARVALDHLRRTPAKRRELENLIDGAVQKYIQQLPSGMMMFGSAAAPAPAAATAPAQEPARETTPFNTPAPVAPPIVIQQAPRPPPVYSAPTHIPMQAPPQVRAPVRPSFRFL
jgi:hypothetical protein